MLAVEERGKIDQAGGGLFVVGDCVSGTSLIQGRGTMAVRSLSIILVRETVTACVPHKIRLPGSM
jgi:hypothetical protein